MTGRSLRAAIVWAVENKATDPRTMAAVDTLAEGWVSLDTMLAYLWAESDTATSPGSMMGIEYSPRKQSAVFTITGQRWNGWMI